MAEPNDPPPGGTDDAALFDETVSNPPVETPIVPEPPTPQEPSPPPEPTVPSGRLREETARAAAAERERDEYRRRFDELYARQAPPQKTEPPKRSDLFEAPSAFVQEEVKPMIDPVQDRINQITEHYSLRSALGEHGKEKVTEARKALESAMGSRDSEAWSVYNRAMSSIDPYGEIMRWHVGREVISTVGTDLNAFREKLLDEALKDPEFRKRADEHWRATAASNGSTVNRPVVPKLPSIGKVGATHASQNDDDNMSDDELFHAATRRR